VLPVEGASLENQALNDMLTMSKAAVLPLYQKINMIGGSGLELLCPAFPDLLIERKM